VAWQPTGDMEYGQMPGGGYYVGNMEFGQCPYVGFYSPPYYEIKGIEMLKTNIPRYKYWISDYPNLDPRAEGQVIPEVYGDIHNITPICVDTIAGKWKIARREIKAIDAVRDGETTLVAGTDYTTDLVHAEFTILQTPYLSPSTTYYFSIEGDWTINGTDFIRVCRNTGYANGQSYNIDDANVWTPSASDILFVIFGKENLEDAESVMLDWGLEGEDWHYGSGWGGWDNGLPLRDNAAHTRLGQSFTNGVTGFYVTKIQIYWLGYGTVTGNIKIKIFSTIAPSETQVGCSSYALDVNGSNQALNFPQRGTPSELLADVQGYMLGQLPTLYPGSTVLMDNVSDIIQDIYVNVLGGAISDLNATDFSALKTARTEALVVYLNEEVEFGNLLQKFEAGQLFKFLPNLSNQFTVKYYASGEPAGTPHLRDEDFVKGTFKMTRNWQAIFQRVQVKYYQNPSSQEWQIVEEISNIAQYVYRNQKTLQIETFLKDKTAATQLAKDYLGTDATSSRKVNLQQPQIILEFENLECLNWDKIPAEKNKITRTRAMSASGNLNGILFRLFEIEKIISSGNCRIKAILDSLTY